MLIVTRLWNSWSWNQWGLTLCISEEYIKYESYTNVSFYHPIQFDASLFYDMFQTIVHVHVKEFIVVGFILVAAYEHCKHNNAM